MGSYCSWQPEIRRFHSNWWICSPKTLGPQFSEWLIHMASFYNLVYKLHNTYQHILLANILTIIAYLKLYIRRNDKSSVRIQPAVVTLSNCSHPRNVNYKIPPARISM